MVVLKNLELAELANTIWSSLFFYHMSGFPLQNLFSRRDTISLELLKVHTEKLILIGELDPSTLYICKACLVKASEGLEHETVIVTVKRMGSESQWELAFDRSQSSSPHDGSASDSSLFEYPLGSRGDMMQAADSSLQSLKVTGRPAEDSVTFLYPYSALAKQDAIAEIYFPAPSPSFTGGTPDNAPNTPLTLISFLVLVELLHEDGYHYKLFSTNCFWISGILLRACSAYSGSAIQGQGQDLQKAGSYKLIPIVDPLLEDKLNIVISKWKIANSEFMSESSWAAM